MPMEDRAAQFSPFAALTGYDDAVKERARLTDKKHIPDESELYALDVKLSAVLSRIGEQPEVTVTYFKPDKKKDGGAYVEKTGRLKLLDGARRSLVFQDGTAVALDDIADIESELLGEITENNGEFGA